MRAHQITKNQMMAADRKVTSGLKGAQEDANLYVSHSSPFLVDAPPGTFLRRSFLSPYRLTGEDYTVQNSI